MPSNIPMLLGVALGGSLGALARFALSNTAGGPDAPRAHWITLIINIIGCLGAGLFLGWYTRRGGSNEALRAFVTTGLLGAFTTFSAYASDSARLVQRQAFLEAALYVVISVVLGLAACGGGLWLAGRLTT